ncbi:MAG: penicillin-binding protein activator LpoB, partial [Deltaproteobacteria bacterium]|nr:penicillin-binding protein activator LpoB [Deltaproteobacteria bacterium]
KAKFVASKEEREEIREEKGDQLEHASEETKKDVGQEYGADFMLKGEINAIEDRAGGKAVVSYQVNFELIDIETNEKVWFGEKEIKKVIEKASYSY